MDKSHMNIADNLLHHAPLKSVVHQDTPKVMMDLILLRLPIIYNLLVEEDEEADPIEPKSAPEDTLESNVCVLKVLGIICVFGGSQGIKKVCTQKKHPRC